MLKLGTRLTLYLSLIIIPVLSGYGYFDILSRRDILIRKMKAEVSGTGMTLKVSLEKISPQEEKGYIQGLIDAVSEYARTLGYREITSMSLNDMILGAIVAVLGLVVAFTGLPQIKHVEKKTT